MSLWADLTAMTRDEIVLAALIFSFTLLGSQLGRIGNAVGRWVRGPGAAAETVEPPAGGDSA